MSALSPQCFGQYFTQVSIQDMPVEINLMHGFATYCRIHMGVHGFLRVNNCIHLIVITFCPSVSLAVPV